MSRTTSEHSVIVMALGPVIVSLPAATLKIEGLTAPKVTGMVISFL